MAFLISFFPHFLISYSSEFHSRFCLRWFDILFSPLFVLPCFVLANLRYPTTPLLSLCSKSGVDIEVGARSLSVKNIVLLG
jgi:hypothetical protein